MPRGSKISWRTSKEWPWQPAKAPDNSRRTQESWRGRWYRLTGRLPKDFVIESDGSTRYKPDRLGHLLDERK